MSLIFTLLRVDKFEFLFIAYKRFVQQQQLDYHYKYFQLVNI